MTTKEEYEQMMVVAAEAGKFLEAKRYESGLCIIHHDETVAMGLYMRPDDKAGHMVKLLHAAHAAILETMKKFGIEPNEESRDVDMDVRYAQRIPNVSEGN